MVGRDTRHRLIRWALIMAALWLAPAAALAGDRTPAAFLGLQALGLSNHQTGGLEQALAARLRQDRRFAFSAPAERAAIIERCQGDRACYCRAAAALKPAVSHLLYANVGRIDPLFTFELVLVRLRGCAVVDSLFVSEMHDPSSANRRIGQLAGRLLKPRASVSETVVKAERDVDRVPAVVTVTTAEQVRRLGITRLTELIRLVPGFEVVDTNWGDLVLHQGLTSTVLYMVDGVPLSNPRINFSTIGRDGILGLNHVERVELVRGPGSVLWGQNAYLGIVNLITRLPHERGERIRAHLRLSTLDSQEVFVGLEGNRRWLSYYLSTTWRRARGAQTRVADSLYGTTATGDVWGNAGTTDNEVDSYFDVIARVRIAGKLELRVQYFTNKSFFEISPFGALLPPDERGWWDTTNLIYAAAWEDTLPHDLRYRLSASRYEHHSWENFIVFPRSAAVLPYGFSALQGNELRPETNHLLEGRIYHTLQRERWSNQALVGLAYLHQSMPEQYITLTTGQSPGVEELDMGEQTNHTASVFLQDDLSLLGGKLLLSAGLRYDWHHPFQSALSTQGAIIGGVDRLFAKLVYTEGFRPPSMNNLHSTTGVKGNRALQPEHSRALALELVGRPLGSLTLRAGGTVAWLTDLIRQQTLVNDPDGFLSEPRNLARTQIYAAYGQAQLDLGRLNAFAGYGFKHLTEEPASEFGLPVAPHTFSAGATLRLFERFNAFVTASLVSPRTIHRLAAGSDRPVEERLKAQVLLDFGLTISDLLGLFDLTIKASNPARYVNRNPYRFDGRATPLVERRQVSEVMFTLGWSGDLPWSDKGRTGKQAGAKPTSPAAPVPPTPPTPTEPTPTPPAAIEPPLAPTPPKAPAPDGAKEPGSAPAPGGAPQEQGLD